MTGWTPFRPTQADLERIARDVAAIPEVGEAFLAKAPGLKVRDRVAHEYQVAGGRVFLRIAPRLPANLAGVGPFIPDAEYAGLGRISIGLGCPHRETDPDFIGLMVAFQDASARRIDILAINHPAAPSADHPDFMMLLHAATDGLGAAAPLIGGLGKRNLPDLIVSNARVTLGLIRRMGVWKGLRAAAHALRQTSRTALSSTAYQTFWSGIVEAGDGAGKIMFMPTSDENGWYLRAGSRHLTEEWRRRQARAPVHFDLYWLPFIDERATPTGDLTESWQERPAPIGRLTFPQIDPDSEESRLWAALTAEMGANPAHWVADAQNDVAEPGTAFGCARKIAYVLSQQSRGALPDEAYAHVFRGADIGDALAAELVRRRTAKKGLGHIDMAPSSM
jgi:hypothetical protein